MRWDIRTPLGDDERFDLVVCTDVLSCVLRPGRQRQAVGVVAGLVAPGGALVVSEPEQDELVERARWARWLGRGASNIIGRFQDPDLGLTVVATTRAADHLVVLFSRPR